jgi:excisionase family DNA binding protein
MAKEPGQWLTLSQAAEMIGVHPSTVRLWSDKGRIPVHRTQGRHRRYLRAEVELWIRAARQAHVLEPDSLVQQALRQMRFQIGESHLEAEGWYQRLDEDARELYRQSGRHLIQGLASYLASEAKGPAAEAGALGYEYASYGRRFGLDGVEAARAFLFFRSTLLESMITVYGQARVPSGPAWGEMLSKVSAFTDQILISLLETFRRLETKRS